VRRLVGGNDAEEPVDCSSELELLVEHGKYVAKKSKNSVNDWCWWSDDGKGVSQSDNQLSVRKNNKQRAKAVKARLGVHTQIHTVKEGNGRE
jgi:protein-arginine kinase